MYEDLNDAQNNVVELFTRELTLALTKWQDTLGKDAVLSSEVDIARYQNCCSQSRRHIHAILLPENEGQIQDILHIAAAHKVPVYPVSTGRNWGFGGANPAVDNCVIIDLHKMNRIIDFDADLGIVTVEPGVTQGQLEEFLSANNYPFMYSAIASSTHCSVMGNALDRGHGMMPHTDRFSSLMSLRAILPDGSVYQPLLDDAGGKAVSRTYKWGVGPYIDGLFSQGSFGVVTEASFALARRPEHVTLFYFRPRDGVNMTEFTDKLREVKQRLGGVVNTIDFGNRMSAEQGKRDSDNVLSPEDLWQRMDDVSLWTAYGSIHASSEMNKAAIKAMQRILKPVAHDFVFVNGDLIKKVENKPKKFKNTAMRRFVAQNIGLIKEMYAYMHGKPQMKALNYTYHHQNMPEKDDKALDGDIKQAGLIWYWPIIPLRGKDVHLFLQMFKQISAKHKIYPTWNLCVESETWISAGIHIFFDPATEKEAADKYHKELFEEGKRLGYLPHRAHIDTMGWYTETEGSHFFDMVKKLKKGLDPNNIMAPGRYGPAGKL